MKYGLVIAFVVGIVVGGLVVLGITSSSWLTQSLTYNLSWDRGREWIGAFSGWVAAAGAFIAAWLTVPHLKRQADFIWGDAPPTLDVIEHLEDRNTLVVRVVNWNRRAIFIKDIVASTTPRPANMEEHLAILKVEGEDGDHYSRFPVQIQGGEDRNARPGFAKIDLILVRQAPGTEAGWQTEDAVSFPEDTRITAQVRMLGDVHREIELHGDAFRIK